MIVLTRPLGSISLVLQMRKLKFREVMALAWSSTAELEFNLALLFHGLMNLCLHEMGLGPFLQRQLVLRKMAQRVKASSATEDVSSSLSAPSCNTHTYTVKGENQLPQLPSDLLVNVMAHMHT